METAVGRVLPDGRLHLQHGPIDLIIEVWGAKSEIASAHEQATAEFRDILGGLASELSTLRKPVDAGKPYVNNAVGRRMVEAVWPHRSVFVTPMAAVAGAVADHILRVLCRQRDIIRAYVNNGGDISLHLAHGEAMALGLADTSGQFHGRVRIHASMPVRGVATSGWRGRSFSLGIADAVTVLALDAAMADVAATLIANEVTVNHPSIRRLPACELDPDSDLGDRTVTVEVGELDHAAVSAALHAGRTTADRMKQAGLIEAAGLLLAGEFVDVGGFQALTAGCSGVASSRIARSLG